MVTRVVGCPNETPPPYPGAASSEPDNLVAFGDTLAFSANYGVGQRELWKSTPDTTMLILDIRPGNVGSDSSWLTPRNVDRRKCLGIRGVFRPRRGGRICCNHPDRVESLVVVSRHGKDH
jgi:ELWxxDGT repeat protein